MTRWGMIANLERCVGCQTCTAACKHVNATSPAVQWRKVLDLEVGGYPDVKRVFVPVGCMHCEDPPCMHVCPSTATGQRKDGIVTIDYELCIGCAYCAVACPYQARYKVDGETFASGSGGPNFAYGGSGQMKNEARREDPARLGVAQKCTFCSDRIDYGLENGLTPGIDPDATPACVNSCIASALHFGDLDNPKSNVSTLLDTHQTFVMHKELGTKPGFHYIWKRKNSDDTSDDADLPFNPSTGIGGVGAAAPWLQQHWDWRAAGNFMGGGTGSGMIVVLAGLSWIAPLSLPLVLIALASIAGGLFLVWLETGRPFRAPLNVLLNARTSWMTREAMVGSLLFPVALISAWFEIQLLMIEAGVVALAFLYCQARILKAAKGIPAWREPAIVNLIVSTGLSEGTGLLLAASILFVPAITPSVEAIVGSVLVALLAYRLWSWRLYREAMKRGAPMETLAVLITMSIPFIVVGHVLPLLLIGSGYLFAEISSFVTVCAGTLVWVTGWAVKYWLITKAAYNQGYAINHAPERGSGGGGPGGQPGWGKVA